MIFFVKIYALFPGKFPKILEKPSKFWINPLSSACVILLKTNKTTRGKKNNNNNNLHGSINK